MSEEARIEDARIYVHDSRGEPGDALPTAKNQSPLHAAVQARWDKLREHRSDILGVLREAVGGDLADEDGVWTEINLVAGIHLSQQSAASKDASDQIRRSRERYETISRALQKIQAQIAEAIAEGDEQMVWSWWDAFTNANDSQWEFAGDIPSGFSDMLGYFTAAAEHAASEFKRGRGERGSSPFPATTVGELAGIYRRATGRDPQADSGRRQPFRLFVDAYLAAVGVHREEKTIDDDIRDALGDASG